MIKNRMRPVHPGEILRKDFLKPLNMSANALSKALHVPPWRINNIVLERRGVTPGTVLRLARFFGGDAQSWLNLQQCATSNWQRGRSPSKSRLRSNR